MPSTNLSDCVKELQDKWPDIVSAFQLVWPKYKLQITCTHRPPEEQFELFKKGRQHVYPDNWEVINPSEVVTYKDGFKNPSRHNLYPSEALDVAVITPGGTTVWDVKYYQCLIAICDKLGLFSGGGWQNFKDWPHIQTNNT